MKCVILLFVLFFGLNVFAQKDSSRWNLDKYVWSHTHYKTGTRDKPVIDFDAIDNWPGLGEYLAISPDGGFIAYDLIKGTGLPHYARKQDSLVVQSTTNSWRKSYRTANPGFFSNDSKKYIYQEKESLCFLKLNGSEARYVEGVSSYKLPADGKNEWMAYLIHNKKKVVLQNLLSGTEKVLDGCDGFEFDNSCNWLIGVTRNEIKDLHLHNLKTGKDLHFIAVESYTMDKNGERLLTKSTDSKLAFINLTTDKMVDIWHPTNSKDVIKEFKIDGSGSQVVFTVEDQDKAVAIWYWKEGMKEAVEKINNESSLDKNLLIQGTAFFSDNDRYIQFYLLPKPDSREPMDDAVQLDIWRYQDTILQSTQPYLLKQDRSTSAILNIETNKIVLAENKLVKIYKLQGDFAIVKKHIRDVYGDRFWEKDYYKDSNWIVSLKDGRYTLLPTRGWDYTLWFSPDGKYLVYYDGERGSEYFSYAFKTGKITNISKGLEGIFCHNNPYLRIKEKQLYYCGLAAWIENSESVLVYDDYDIWKLDLSGKNIGINLTNGYGRKNNILFTLQNSDRFIPTSLQISLSEDLIFRAFNKQNKYCEFYTSNLQSYGDPKLLFSGPYFFEYINSGTDRLTDGMHPLKALNVNKWIVQRQSANEAPNYFLTNDFKNYKQLTNIQPQSNYNWVTTELVTFTQLDGTLSQGILYKPENFDPTKKYPVILSFYAQFSDQLFQFPSPGYIDRPSLFNNPAWMVSHGYLVFTPDIYFSENKWGPSTINTIDGAARHLKTLPYIDTTHLGAVGHSNSGRFGYYVLTHSKSFAAMSVGAGVSNALSTALRFTGSHNVSALEIMELTSLGTGLGNIWENKENWINHTSVLHADQVTSPLLLFHNKKDGAFSAGTALEMYISLRRLEKPVWWLQYDEGLHTLLQLRDLKDFTIRYTQYFDHYLKGAPPPRWMSQGIPYNMKGVESGNELDPSGSCGKDCKVCKK